jgi:hypothetical protein
LQIADCRLQIGSGVAALVVCLVLGAAPRPAQCAEIIDRVLAIAAGEIITLTDVNAAREFGLVDGTDGPDPIRAILSRLIDRSLMLSEVERNLPPEPDDREVAAVLAKIQGRFPTAGAFEQALARVGFDEQHLRALVRENLRIRAYLEQRFAVASLSEADVERFYEDHPEVSTRNGRRAPLDEVRAEVIAAGTQVRRQASIEQWVRGLRRRAEVVDLYVSAR